MKNICWVPTNEIIQVLRELRNANEMGQFTYPDGNREQQVATQALQRANELLEKWDSFHKVGGE